MSILVNADTRIICQGMTGRQGTFFCDQAMAYGSRIVAGVSPGKGGSRHLHVPVFDRVAEAMEGVGADASVIFVPPRHAADAMMEAINARVPLVVCVTEGVPTLDMVRVRRALMDSPTRLIGPNSIGIITPGQCKIGVMPGHIHSPGRVGVISRSSTLTYEVVAQTTATRLGQSTVVSVGGDPVHGMSFVDCLELMLADDATDAVVLVGEIGGDEEEQAAGYLRRVRPDKPVFALVAGLSAPRGRRMGHAGAMIAGGAGDAASKIALLSEAGVTMVSSPARVGHEVAAAL